MKILSTKEFADIYDNLPEGLKTAINSDVLNSALNDILKNNHLADSKAIEFRRITAAIILGVVHPEDLEREVISKVHMDPRATKGIADEIRLKVLSRVAGELNKTHGFHLPVAQGVYPNAPQQPLIAHALTPADQPTVTSRQESSVPINPKQSEGGVNPLVIHKYQGSDQPVTSREDKYEGGLARPTFYSPDSHSDFSPTPYAHIEMGDERTSSEPSTVRMGKEQAKIVHYSAPEAPANPFSGIQNMPQTKPAVEKKDVPQSNVVNLKDLPQ